MKKVALLAASLLAGTANAALITETERQTQSTNGQSFTFDIATSDLAAGSSSSLTLNVQGDFNGQQAQNEYVASILIEGLNYGAYTFTSAESYNVAQAGGSNFNAYRFSVDFAIDAATTSLFLADDNLNVVVDFGSGVTERYGWWTTSNGVRAGVAPHAELAFTYDQAEAVSEPGSLALIGLGLVGLGAVRRKKQA